MALFCVAIRRDSVSLLRFPFLRNIHVFSCDFPYLSLGISSQLFFFPFRFSSYCWSADPWVVSDVSGHCNESIYAFYAVFETTYRCINTIFNVLFLFLFLTHIVCLYHLENVWPYTKSLVFLFSGPFAEVLLLSTLRIFSSMLQGGQPTYLSFWWDFCYAVWFRIVFSFSWGILFHFHFRMFDSVRFQYTQVFVSFFFSDHSDLVSFW